MSQRKRIVLTIAAATIAALIWTIVNGIADAGTRRVYDDAVKNECVRMYPTPPLTTLEPNEIVSLEDRTPPERGICLDERGWGHRVKDYDVAGMATSAAPVLLVAGLAVFLTLLWIKDDEPAV